MTKHIVRLVVTQKPVVGRWAQIKRWLRLHVAPRPSDLMPDDESWEISALIDGDNPIQQAIDAMWRYGLMVTKSQSWPVTTERPHVKYVVLTEHGAHLKRNVPLKHSAARVITEQRGVEKKQRPHIKRMDLVFRSDQLAKLLTMGYIIYGIY